MCSESRVRDRGGTSEERSAVKEPRRSVRGGRGVGHTRYGGDPDVLEVILREVKQSQPGTGYQQSSNEWT